MNKQMVDALNSLIVDDWSASCGELEYVLAENSEENRKILLEAGFTEEQLNKATDGGRTDIDLTLLARYYTDAVWWDENEGFKTEGDGNDA